jgi:hypothetical protein
VGADLALHLEVIIRYYGFYKNMGIRPRASVIGLPRSLDCSPPERFAFYRLERALKSTVLVRERIRGYINRLLGRSCHPNFWRDCECIEPLHGKLVNKRV